LNSLLWDYAPSDLEVIAKHKVFGVIAGEISPNTFNPLRCAWGKEKYNYSVENLDKNTE